MPLDQPVLHMMCGKIAAGKSTLAHALAQSEHTVLISEDAWLAALYGEHMSTVADYVSFSAKLQSAMAPHVVTLLNADISVVLDFPANTKEQRAWMRGVLDRTDVSHQMHVLVPPDEVCLERLRKRNADGTHPFSVTEEQFFKVSKHFVPPSSEEGFSLVLHE